MQTLPLRARSHKSHACSNKKSRGLRLNVLARGGGRNNRVQEMAWRGPDKLRMYKTSDGEQHLGSVLRPVAPRPFPGPPPDEGPPLRVLPIGGLGEIGMNCMLVGVRDRYIVIDAGLMFPDFSDLGMQKILPDASFLHEWKDKIEALVITHGHEDHIGAMPWVVPALDPSTPIYASSFVMQLIKKRMSEYSLFDENRFKTFQMREKFQAGPFEIEPIRVTHSIPDCCGLVMRSSEGTIVHTGDWKIDESPLDGQQFDRETFDMLGKEKVALFMSDSTNVLSPGRTSSEKTVYESIIQKVLGHQNKGRVIITQFASNLARLYAVKAAADASGRKICFVGASLSHYLEAAWQDGRAPFDPKELISPDQMKHEDPNKLLIVSTGSQGEPNAQLSKAANQAAQQLKIMPDDLLLYSAKVIPGNEPQVSKMLNSLAMLGARVVQGRGDNLHTSGHAYQEELKEVMRYVKPQHFLPVHGEYAFLTEHARLAREEAGVEHCSVIRNGQMLGIYERSSRRHISSGSMAKATIEVIGEANLVNYYNDGGKGTGTQEEMGLADRTVLAFEGIVVVAIDVRRDGQMGPFLQGGVRLTTRGMWTDGNRLKALILDEVKELLTRLPLEAPLQAVERAVVDGVKRVAKKFNGKKPEVICICHERDPSMSHLSRAAANRAANRGSALGGPGRGRAEPRSAGGGGGRAPAPAGWGGAIPDDDVEVIEHPSSRRAAAGGRAGVRGAAGRNVTRLGGDEEEQGTSVDSDDSPIIMPGSDKTRTEAMLAARRRAAAEADDAAPKPRRRAAGAGGPGGLTPVSEEFMRSRRAANPRENPGSAARQDPDSVAFD